MSVQKPKFYWKIDEISAAVREAHQMGSFGKLGKVEVNLATGEISVSQFLGSLPWIKNHKTIYSNFNSCWYNDLNLKSVIVDGMYIVHAKNLNEYHNGRDATEKEKKIAGLIGDVKALTEHELYNDTCWSSILYDKINTAAEMYGEITHNKYWRHTD